jgi:hypothetical protein
MKKSVLSLALLVMLTQVFSQEPTVPAPTETDYLQKSKDQKTTAWVLLVGGAAAGVLGFTKAKHITNDDAIGFTEGFSGIIHWSLVGVAGTTLAACSIPLFASARKNARKAVAISFGTKRIPMLQQNTMVSRMHPTLQLQIPF